MTDIDKIRLELDALREQVVDLQTSHNSLRSENAALKRCLSKLTELDLSSEIQRIRNEVQNATLIPAHLGYYVKSKELLALKDQIFIKHGLA